MSATYTCITAGDFEDFITGLVPGAELADPEGVSEEVWDLPLPHDDLSIRVFSTVAGGEGRDRGSDAIRCTLWHHGEDAPVGGRRKTLRIGPSESNPEGWRRNLREKVEDLYANWRSEYNGRCPKCSGVLVKREPGAGDDWSPFLACSRWDGGDGCEYTEWL
jgi:hypothetical protein